MSGSSASDGGETTLGSPASALSPCLWAGDGLESLETRVLASERLAASPVAEEPSDSFLRALASSPVVAGTIQGNGSPAAEPRRALVLSPAAQLDVLSQISELAELAHSQAGVGGAGAQLQDGGSRAWTNANHPTKKRAARTKARNSLKSDGKAQRQRNDRPHKKRKKAAASASLRSERLEADMLDWESCSDEMFLSDSVDAVNGEADEWVFDDISDSDFD